MSRRRWPGPLPTPDVAALMRLAYRSPFRGAPCSVAHAYDWQRLEHHLASLRLGINSAPQLPQISTRLVAGFRRSLRPTIGRSFVMRRILFKQRSSRRRYDIDGRQCDLMGCPN